MNRILILGILLAPLGCVAEAQSGACTAGDEACWRSLITGTARAEAYDATYQPEKVRTSSVDPANSTKVLGWARLLEYYAATDYNQAAVKVYANAGADRPSWCGIFDVWVYREVLGKQVPVWHQGSGASNQPAFEAVAKSAVKPGDVCTYTYDPTTGAKVDHHAMIEYVRGDGTFDVINGNGSGGAVTLSSSVASSLYEGCYRLRSQYWP